MSRLRNRLLIWGSLALVALMLGLAAPGLKRPSVALTRDFEVDGTVDCEQPSGQHCPIGDVLALWTEDLSGTIERVILDVSWIRRPLERLRLKQDDLLCLEVRDMPGERPQAIGLVEPCDVGGTINRGLSTADREMPEQPNRPGDDHEVFTASAPTATGTLAGPASATTISAPTATSTQMPVSIVVTAPMATPTPANTPVPLPDLTINTPVPLPDLTIAKADNPDPAAFQLVTYTSR